ncbi:MAG: 3-dehydroquinate synthase [Bacteroidota bacterium]
MQDYPIHIGADALPLLGTYLQQRAPSQVLVLVDPNTHQHCYPRLRSHLPTHQIVKIPAGESHKTLATCEKIWQQMTDLALDRNAIVLNLGGGVIGDMGGFVAATYKRGIDFVQVPTTLLSQVDASVGGKLGVDFRGFKNHIGLFKEPQGVFIDPDFLNTLSVRELRSGFAEVIKHHLIYDAPAWAELVTVQDLSSLDWSQLVRHSVDIKERIVAEDPFEKGLRKALNFGHTIGHAIESHYLESEAPLLHGEAIAIGMIAESFLSMKAGHLNPSAYDQIQQFFLRHYGHVSLDPEAYPAIWERMKNDKKNLGGKVLCTYLDGIGTPLVNQSIEQERALDALRAYQEAK